MIEAILNLAEIFRDLFFGVWASYLSWLQNHFLLAADLFSDILS